MRSRAVLVPLCVLLAVLGCRKDDASTTSTTGTSSAAPNVNGPAMASAIGSGIVANLGNTDATVQGTIHSEGGDLGTWDITLVQCQSGERNGFFGADFYVAGSDDLRVRYVHDEGSGDVVKLAVPGSKDGKFMVFNHDAACSVLEGSVEKSNIKTWTPKGDIRHVSGHVKFDCKNTGGKGHVQGDVTFSHCH